MENESLLPHSNRFFVHVHCLCTIIDTHLLFLDATFVCDDWWPIIFHLSRKQRNKGNAWIIYASPSPIASLNSRGNMAFPLFLCFLRGKTSPNQEAFLSIWLCLPLTVLCVHGECYSGMTGVIKQPLQPIGRYLGCVAKPVQIVDIITIHQQKGWPGASTDAWVIGSSASSN